jgi:putative transcriptional regulator
VILLADHDKEGSVGFIINKPLKYTIHDWSQRSMQIQNL